MIEVSKKDLNVDKVYALCDIRKELEDENVVQWEFEINKEIITVFWSNNENMFIIISKKGEEEYYTLEELIEKFYNLIF